MKILVTGGVGFVGTNLIKKLLLDGHQVVSLDNYSTGKKDNEVEHKNVSYFNVDLRYVHNYDSYVSKPAIIYHMAALARIQPSIKDPVTAIQNNFDSTLNVLEWARGNNTPVIFAGSSSYHHGLWGSPYAWSKFGGEQLCELYNKVYELPIAICRFYNVYGPHQLESGTYATVIGIFERQYREGKPLTVTGDGEQRRDFTHIDDIVDGIVKCGDDVENISGEIFELGSGLNFSINQIANFFGGKIKYIPKRPGEYDATLCDYKKANKLLEWKPTKNIEKYIKGVIHDKS